MPLTPGGTFIDEDELARQAGQAKRDAANAEFNASKEKERADFVTQRLADADNAEAASGLPGPSDGGVTDADLDRAAEAAALDETEPGPTTADEPVPEPEDDPEPAEQPAPGEPSEHSSQG